MYSRYVHVIAPGVTASFSLNFLNSLSLLNVHVHNVFSADTKHEMYFPQLIQVISRSCFRFMPAAPTIVHFVLYSTCPDWPVISTYILRCLLSTIHTCGSIQSIHLSGLHPPPPSRLLQVSSLLSSFRPQKHFCRLLLLFQIQQIWTLGQGL